MPSYVDLEAHLCSMVVPSPVSRRMIDEAAWMCRESLRRAMEAREAAPADRFLDVQYRDLVADPIGTVRRIYDGFALPFSPEFEARLCAYVITTFPDWEGRHWFVTQRGRAGFWAPGRDAPETVCFEGERFFNALSADEEGNVFVVSDHAIYGLCARTEGPRVLWRETYPRATVPCVSKGFGSGTSAKLLGDRWVAIADRSDPIRVMVYDRRRGCLGPRLHGAVSVFGPGQSMTETSFVGYDRSLVVANNHRLPVFGDWPAAAGMARVDVSEGDSALVWENRVRPASGALKLATEQRLVYTFTGWEETYPERWSVVGVDLDSGDVACRWDLGSGRDRFPVWAPITLGPEGTLYTGAGTRIVGIRDR